MRALICKYAGHQTIREINKFASNPDTQKWETHSDLGRDYQIKDIYNFIKHFDQIDPNYLTIPSPNNVFVEIQFVGSGDLTRNFLNREIEKDLYFKEYLQSVRADTPKDSVEMFINGLYTGSNSASIMLTISTGILAFLAF